MNHHHHRIAAAVLVSLGALLVGGATATASDTGMAHIAGVGVPGAPGDGPCDEPDHLGADYAIALSGDLDGCIYGYITSFREHPSGTYGDRGDEVFVGAYDGREGTFAMIQHFTAKFDPETGAQQFGRCQHPIVDGSGTGALTGITGRLDFKDDVAAGVAVYRGHLGVG